MFNNKNIPFGSQKDKESRVDIGQVYGGVFSDPENISKFIKYGIETIKDQLPKDLNYVDFGGGQGLLAKSIKDYLEQNNYQVDLIVADANDEYLQKAKSIGLKIKLCNLETEVFPNTDLITMRSVLHYNSLNGQREILTRVYESLNPGGFFVNQFTTGTKLACEMRSEIINHPLLGRAKYDGQYKWITINDEYMEMMKSIGFTSNNLTGYGATISWGPLEQWDRYHGIFLKEAKEQGNTEEVSRLKENRDQYLEESKKIIAKYLSISTAEELGVHLLSDGNYKIDSIYPIIVSKKLP